MTGLGDFFTPSKLEVGLPSSSEFQPQLKRDHARRVIASQADAQQACGWRGRRDQRAESGLRARLARNSGHRSRQGEIRVVEEIEELALDTKRHPLVEGEPLS